MPRINFVSFTFLFAFGLGAFAGIAMALLAVALARPADETRIIDGSPVVIAVTATPRPTTTPTPEPSATPSPTPLPRTTSTLQVRIGPDEDYAILGTLARGNEINLQGRDDTGAWIAIDFPPGSSARGWIPRTAVEGISLVEVIGLEVLQASLIDTSPRRPGSPSTPTTFEGNDGIAAPEDDDPPTSPDGDETPSPSRTPTATPRPVVVDLALRSVTVGPTGNIRVVVQNLGPDNVAGFSLRVTVENGGQETLRSGVLRAGDSIVFPVTTILITQAATVTVEADPIGQLNDTDPSNNAWTLTLTP